MSDIGSGPIPIEWGAERLAKVRVTVVGITEFGLIDGPRTVEVPIPQPDEQATLAAGLAKRVEETLMAVFEEAKQ